MTSGETYGGIPSDGGQEKVPRLLILGNNRHSLTDCDVYTFNGERDGDIFIPRCPAKGEEDFPGMTSRAVTVDNSVYLIGCDLVGVYKLDTDSLQWSRQCDLLAGVENPCASSIGRFIICIGSEQATDLIQIYDTRKDKWYWGTEAPREFSDAACVAHENNIIVSGGRISLSQYRYDFSSEVWSLLMVEEPDNDTITVKYESMPDLVLARASHNMGVVNGDIYVIGGIIAGDEGTPTIEVLMANTSQFILCIHTLPIVKHKFSLVTHQGELYILPSPNVDKSLEHNTDHKETIPGEEHDDTLLILMPHQASQLPKYSVKVKKICARRKYDSGAQGAKVFLPANPPETLMSFLSKMQFLPRHVTDPLRILSEAGRHRKNFKFDDVDRIFADCIGYIFDAIFTGSDATVCLLVMDTLAAFISPTCPYEIATELLLQRRKFVVTAGERYVSILKHLCSKGILVQPTVLRNLFYTENDCVPFIQAAASNAQMFQQVCFYLSRMIDKDGLLPVLENIIDLHLKRFFLRTYMSEEFVEQFGSLKLARRADKFWRVHLMTCHDEFVDQQVPSLALMFEDLLTSNRNESDEEFLKRHAPLLKKLFVNVDVNDPCGHADSIKLCELDWENRNKVPHCYHSDMIFYQRCNNFKYNTEKVEKQKQSNDVTSSGRPDDNKKNYRNLEDFEMSPSEENNLLPKLQFQVTQLFEEINDMLPSVIPGGELLQFSLRLAGSLGEGTKIGRFDEFDLQLELKNISRLINRVVIGCTGNVSINKEDRKYCSDLVSSIGSRCTSDPVSSMGSHCSSEAYKTHSDYEDSDNGIEDKSNTVFMNEESEVSSCPEAETCVNDSDKEKEFPDNQNDKYKANCGVKETRQDGDSACETRDEDITTTHGPLPKPGQPYPWELTRENKDSGGSDSDEKLPDSENEEYNMTCGIKETRSDGECAWGTNGQETSVWTTHGPRPKSGQPCPWELARENNKDSGSSDSDEELPDSENEECAWGTNGQETSVWTTHGPRPKPGQPYPWELARENSNDSDDEDTDSCAVEEDYLFHSLKNTTLFGDKFTWNLQNCLQNIDWSKYSLLVISTAHPWEFMWQEPGPYCGMRISVDVVPVITIREDQDIEVEYSKEYVNEYRPVIRKLRLGSIMNDPKDQEIKLVMKWGRPGGKHRWTCSVSPTERDIMWSLPSYICNAYKLVKLLLEIDYWKNGAHYTHAEKPITSYMVKNAMFWLLLEDISKSDPPKLTKLTLSDSKPENNLQVEQNEASRQWAVRILQYLKSETEKRFVLKTFFGHNIFLYNGCSLRDIRDLCEKYLKFLKK